MCGVVTAATVVGTAVSAASTIDSMVSGGGSSGGGGGGGGSSGQLFNTTAGNVPNPNYSRPLGDSSIAAKAQEGAMPSPEPIKGGVSKAQVSTAREQPAAGDEKTGTTPEVNDVWASRLSHYLDYNTRSLG
jgi:hypothetical protein